MPYSNIDEAEKKNPGLKKYSDKAKRGWLSAFNSCMKDSSDESKCYKIAYSVANKVDGKKASEEIESFKEIRDREDPDGMQHDLHLICVQCGTEQTCRCCKPKRDFYGLCNRCADPEEWNRKELEFEEKMAELCRTNYSVVASNDGSEEIEHNDKYRTDSPCNCCAVSSELLLVALDLGHIEPKISSELVSEVEKLEEEINEK